MTLGALHQAAPMFVAVAEHPNNARVPEVSHLDLPGESDSQAGLNAAQIE